MQTYHIRPDNENMTPLIAGILAQARGKRGVTLEFEKGTYYFRREGSGEFDLFSSGGRSVRNHAVFPFRGIRGLILRGSGAEFVFCDRLQPFMFQNCVEIRLENFSMDNSFLRYAYGTVTGAVEAVEISGNSFGCATGFNLLVKSFRPETANRLHRQIRLENNRFALPREKALKVSGVRELTLTNNTFAGGTENGQDS